MTIDFDQVNLGDYAAVIMAANYTSVRLRWNEASTTSQDPAEAARNTPAVRFFHSAMHNRKVLKGAPCHALCLLTPVPDVLVGRRVTCNPVMLAASCVSTEPILEMSAKRRTVSSIDIDAYRYYHAL